MPVRAQRRAVDERVRERIDHLVSAAAEEIRHHRRGRHAHEQDVVEAHAVEAVLESEAALDLMRLDHAREHVAHDQRRPVGPHRLPADIVRDREDPT